jgi:hypothetical protein
MIRVDCLTAEYAENAEILRMNSALFAGLSGLCVAEWAFFSAVRREYTNALRAYSFIRSQHSLMAGIVWRLGRFLL